MESINKIEFEEALTELGRTGMFELAELLAWLEERRTQDTFVLSKKRLKALQTDWHARFAPSIISRGIAELFEVSLPRFAIRVYANKERTSFVNALRIGTLANQARWRRSVARDGREVTLRGDRSLSDVIRKSTFCVGDSVLAVPSRFANFLVIREWFGTEYGEDRLICGVPYVRNIELNGLCAQATCFMATALLHRIALNTPGITEITCLAQAGKGQVILYGLTPAQMCRYFEKVELRMSLQSVGRSVLNHEAKPVCLFERVLTGYLRSKCPVILPLDSGRMAGLGATPTNENIFAFNGLSSNRITDRKVRRPRRHVVLAVGFRCH
ncbi:MAG: hypothetical protein ACAI37_23910, partial [Chthoniobacter sp.]